MSPMTLDELIPADICRVIEAFVDRLDCGRRWRFISRTICGASSERQCARPSLPQFVPRTTEHRRRSFWIPDLSVILTIERGTKLFDRFGELAINRRRIHCFGRHVPRLLCSAGKASKN
jgi:hypothetical protein